MLGGQLKSRHRCPSEGKSGWTLQSRPSVSQRLHSNAVSTSHSNKGDTNSWDESGKMPCLRLKRRGCTFLCFFASHMHSCLALRATLPVGQIGMLKFYVPLVQVGENIPCPPYSA